MVLLVSWFCLCPNEEIKKKDPPGNLNISHHANKKVYSLVSMSKACFLQGSFANIGLTNTSQVQTTYTATGVSSAIAWDHTYSHGVGDTDWSSPATMSSYIHTSPGKCAWLVNSQGYHMQLLLNNQLKAWATDLVGRDLLVLRRAIFFFLASLESTGHLSCSRIS